MVPGQPPSEFVRLVRDALAHLFDPAHLLQQPLTELLAESLPQRGDAAQGLRDFLLDAIESLAPPGIANPEERERRPHLVLMHRYVDGFTTEDIVERLHISPRQFQREHQKGLYALASYLWGFCRDRARQQPARLTSPAGSLQDEVDALGVEAEALALSELVASAEAPGRALARRYGVTFAAQYAQGEGRCICDRTLAKQALLSCLSALLSSRPRVVQVAVASHHRSPCVEVSVTPPQNGSGIETLGKELGACRTLLSAQGGSLQVLEDGAGLVYGLRLLFPAEIGPHVLVVDDNETMLQLYERCLAMGRWSVTTAASAQEAEEILRRATPDAIVLDVMMREVDGWELLQRLRSQRGLEGVPIIVCSILDERELALALGAQSYLKKPIVPDDLLAALDQALSGA